MLVLKGFFMKIIEMALIHFLIISFLLQKTRQCKKYFLQNAGLCVMCILELLNCVVLVKCSLYFDYVKIANEDCNVVERKIYLSMYDNNYCNVVFNLKVSSLNY